MHYNNIPIDWNEVHGVIDASETVMLTTHENPDGDGLGSESGLYCNTIYYNTHKNTNKRQWHLSKTRFEQLRHG